MKKGLEDFEKRYSELLEERIKQALEQVKQAVLREAFEEEIQRQIPGRALSVTGHFADKLELAYFIGRNPITAKFWIPVDRKIVLLGGEERLPRPVYCLPELDFEEAKSILSAIRNTPKVRRTIVVPPKHFVFRWTAQWASGGNEGEAQRRTEVICADSFEEALKKLPGYFRWRRENCHSNFQVARPGDECFQTLFPTKGSINGVIFGHSPNEAAFEIL